jgi:transposase
MEDVLEVYQRAYDPLYPVICLDETPQQMIGETGEGLTDSQGVIHQDYEYERKGVADIYVISEPLAGKREMFVTENHTAHQWAEIVAYIAEEMYPEAEKISLVQDNLAAHKKAALYEIFTPERARSIIKRIEFVFTPKHGSWLNIAEIELSIFKRTGLKSRIGSREELIQIVKDYESDRNEITKKINWQFKTTDARIKLKRLYPTI